ncbi:MAG: phenylalanine--tRNA ligase subunit alpha [Simkaniaceae bacterium]|nr:phenylalanine--tRNA ligase subunit alpha [Simkaniaceae bacterium]MCF7853130.1 phenylalanine--tRNA ligase subunit alpha [Simkaniaceae bacterium]
MSVISDIEKLSVAFEKDLLQASKAKDLEDLKIKYLGKRGPIAALMESLKGCLNEERPHMGRAINDLKVLIAKKIDEQHAHLKDLEINDQLAHEEVDIALPGRRTQLGGSHIVPQMLDEVLDILISMGFSVQYSPELDSEYYNYGGLNYPEDHPARDMQDTYYVTPELLLRSHTTNIQQRIMQAANPPIRIVSPGKCYRNETISSRSHVIFHQFDGLYIDKNVTFKDLLATQEEFYSRLFKKKVEIRTRPSYFPFVEPGLEIDIRCTSCDGAGCSLCKHTGWLEVCGAGMVHPEILREGGLDPDIYSGFAWGAGIERLCLLRHGIPDIRLFMENDMRFLRQFP